MSTPWANFTWGGTQQQKAPTLPDFFGRTPAATEVLKPVSLAKVPGADPYISNAFSDAGANRTRNLSDLAAFRAALTGTMPQTAGWADQEIGDLGNVYSPNGYEAMIGASRANRAGALRNLNSELFTDTIRALGLDRVGSGGASGAGLGSYLMRGAQAQAGKLRAGEAYDAAAQERADIAALMAARQGGYGRRQSINDSALQRMLLASQAENSGTGNYNALINQALQQALANLTQGFGLNASAAY